MSGGEGATTKVVWLLNKGDNTGMGQGGCGWAAGAVLRNEECVQQRSSMAQTLLEWCADNGFERHECSLCAAFGMNIAVYAKRGGREHQGRNNMIATFLSVEPDSLLAIHGTVVGKAVVLRFDQAGNPVDLPLQEFAVVTSFLNDIMQCAEPSEEREHAATLRMARAVFPYYTIGDTLENGGFGGNKRWCSLKQDGTLELDPPDMAVRPTYPC
mmetsp:Transcript_57153/g.135729  ORF Transcript_57153/g.135729 Transcript_57153/m.135729 type:complete len:213 (+) Transcript_57153:191-829(+)